MGLNTQYIIARDLPDAWFQAVDCCLENGRQWTVEEGSYEGQKRWELDHITIHIKHPGTRPLVPEMPQHLSHIPPPTTIEYVNDYLPYLMTDALKKNEQYTYGSRIAGCIRKKNENGFQKIATSQIDTVIERFKRNHGTNQCSMSIAQPSDIHLPDPPCLREIDCRIIAPDGLYEGEEPALHLTIYFRSWDLWGGFPANLAAVRLLQEYMAEEIGVEAGEMIVSSKGLHIYDHVWNLAKLRVGK
jgi:thymidylate synthase